MQNMNNTLITIKDIPESADDSIIVEFLTNAGCKTVGRVNHRKIRYNNRLTNCSNGDRLIYIEQKPTKAIQRNVKIGTHWARVFYNGQELDREQITHTASDQNKANDDTQTAVSTPTTESNMDFIDRAYEEHVSQTGKENNTSTMGESPNTEDKQKQSEESESDDKSTEPTTKKDKKKKKKQKKGKKKQDDNTNEDDTPVMQKEKPRQRSNSLGDMDEAKVSSILKYLRKGKESQPAKRPREPSSSSETAQTLPTKKTQMEDLQQRESSFAEEETQTAVT
ncbi:PREDICTED: uncharacterized protein LOC109467222 [Branchiostoma belcheri]|uniref:Uncharacterized protein LOC109467222 n=1 Tax=Branchiostoma belcheri TaxID=7741 RepID=A0A6P4XVR1_BRABE|nr:PREDICTED: uncharacterized protein LOC109467222 [Branchiostoma belcheri]